MNTCPYCGANYPDEVKVCPIDHAPMTDWPAGHDPAQRKKVVRRLFKLAMILTAIVLVLFTIAIYSTVSKTFTISGWAVSRKFYAQSRLIVKIKDEKPALLDVNFYQDQIRTITNLLHNPEIRSILATTSRTDEKSFSFDEVHPVRGTRLIYIEYSGVNSNAVRSVASNAADLVVSFYSTNFPSLEASNIDSFSCDLVPFWKQLHRELQHSWWWPFP